MPGLQNVYNVLGVGWRLGCGCWGGGGGIRACENLFLITYFSTIVFVVVVDDDR